MAQFTGRVVWFNSAKGFGFLSADGIKDVFCHFTAIQNDGYKSLNEAEAVEFDVEQGEKGLQAANVRRLARRSPVRDQIKPLDSRAEVSG